MPPIARLGDMTAHGTPLSNGGSDDVHADGMPLWRVGADVHQCPLVTGVQPHVGGPVVTGSSSVLVNGVPVARMGDSIQEAVGVNTIVSGAPTVLVGEGTTGVDPSGSVTTGTPPADGTGTTPGDDGIETTPTPSETLTPTPTTTAPPTRERYEITDSTYTVQGDTQIFFDLPKEATVFLAVSSLEGTPLSVYTLPGADVRALAQNPDSAPTVPELTFTGVTEASGQADLEAREWAVNIRNQSPEASEKPPETRFHLSLQVAWIGGPPGG